jgi:hypothetical protein
VYIAQRLLGIGVDGEYGNATNKAVNAATRLAAPRNVFDFRIAGVHWHSQRDNRRNPDGTCNVTSLAMVLDFLGVTPGHPDAQLEDELFDKLLSPAGLAKASAIGAGSKPWTVPGMLTWLVQQCGKQDNFSEAHSWGTIWNHVSQRRIPVVISGMFTDAGHIVVIVGRTTDGDVLVHDPYGDWIHGYSRIQRGDYRVYPKTDFERVTLQASGGMRAHLIS